MKKRKWITGLLAAMMLCVLPMSSVLAEEGALPGAETKPLKKPMTVNTALVSETGELTEKTEFVYGETVQFTAAYTKPEQAPALTGEEQVVFTKQDPKDPQQSVELGRAPLVAIEGKQNQYSAVLTLKTTDRQLLPGTTKVTAQLMLAETAENKIAAQKDVTLQKKTLWAEPAKVTYNGTTVFEGAILNVSGVLNQDEVFATADLTAADKNAAVPQEDNLTEVGAPVLSGKDAGWYRLPAENVAKKLAIQKKEITVSGIAAVDKKYDGTAAAKLSGVTFDGLVNGETLAEGDYTFLAEFEAPNVQQGLTVTAKEFALADTPTARNYTLTNAGEAKTAQAAILPRELTVTGFAAGGKVYDGTTAATVSELYVEGLQNGETLEPQDYTVNAVFADANAGTDKVVSLESAELNENAKTMNYTLTYDTADKKIVLAAIEPKDLNEAMLHIESEKLIYDGSQKQCKVTLTDKAEDGTNRITEEDYQLTWGENKEPGSATVAVLGKRNYKGSITGTFAISKSDTGVYVSMNRVLEADGTAKLKFVGRFTRPSEAANLPTGTVTILLLDDGKTSSVPLNAEGVAEIRLPDLKDAAQCRYKVKYEGDSRYNPLTTTELHANLNPVTPPTPEQPTKPEPPAPPAKPAEEEEWYNALSEIQKVKQGKVTVDAGEKIAVPHFIWQSIYGKDITLTIRRGSENFVFNGLDLKATGFNPDVGHNLTDLSGYVNRTYPKPEPPKKPEPDKKPEETNKPEETVKPTEKPQETQKPEETQKPAETQKPTEAPEETPAQGEADEGTPTWLYWVIGIAGLLAAVLVVILIVTRRRDEE